MLKVLDVVVGRRRPDMLGEAERMARRAGRNPGFREFSTADAEAPDRRPSLADSEDRPRDGGLDRAIGSSIRDSKSRVFSIAPVETISKLGPVKIRSCAVLNESHLGIFSLLPGVNVTRLALHFTPCPKPVILDGCLSATIIAINKCFGVSELRRHRLVVDLSL